MLLTKNTIEEAHPATSLDTINSVLELKGRQVWSVTPTAVVYDAIRAMSDMSVGALLVMSEGRLYGIVSERDYARKVILRDRSSRITQVQEIMTTPVITVAPKDTVGTCMRLMTEHRIRHLPVLDGDRVVGIVSIGDLVNWIVTAQEEMIGQLEGYICGKYPG
jgi:CBS domain-containing protein